MKRALRGLVGAAVASLIAPSAQAQSYEVYGGATFGSQSLNYGPQSPSSPNLQQMDAGLALGGGVYWALPNSFEAGFDVMSTAQDYTSWSSGANLSSFSIMGNARSVFAMNNSADFLFGAGLGAIQLTYEDAPGFGDGSDVIGGWQTEAGVRYQLATNELFAVIKYQAGFDEAVIQDEAVEYNATSLNFGIRF